MKNLISCLGFFLLYGLAGHAQLLPGFPRPSVYFSFNKVDARLNGYFDDYNPNITAQGFGFVLNNDATDRFGSARALNFPVTGTGGLPTLNEHYVVAPGTLFGLPGLSDNFTISCWVFVSNLSRDSANGTTRRIFNCININSDPSTNQTATFALQYKGRDIYLRRYASQVSGLGYHDYKFWAPAQFNGDGWYEIFLVGGVRSDLSRYVKLYVGKPNYIAYDAQGPRVVPPNSDPLAWQFGGAYAFLSNQDAFNSATLWELGNSNESPSKVDGSTIAPVSAMDDFTVWNVALTENQAKQLFLCQSKTSGGNDNCWSSSPIPNANGTDARLANGRTVITDSAATRAGNSLQAYASSRSTLQVNLTLAGPQGVNLYLYDMNGRLLLEKADIAGFQGLNTQQLATGSLTAGTYIVKAVGVGLNLVQKVQIW